MPTDKPRVTFTISKEQLSKLESFKYENRIKNQTQAILTLIDKGLSDYEPKPKEVQSLSGEALSIAKDYQNLDKWGKKVVRSVIADEKARCESERHDQPKNANLEDNVLPLRCSTQAASAGTGCYLGPEEWEPIYVQENDLTRHASFCVPVSGNSMEPRFHDGDVLVIDDSAEVELGQVGLYTIDGEGFVKIYGGDHLISLNPEYPDVPMTEDSRCNGKVIGVLKTDWIMEG